MFQDYSRKGTKAQNYRSASFTKIVVTDTTTIFPQYQSCQDKVEVDGIVIKDEETMVFIKPKQKCSTAFGITEKES